MEKYNFDGDLCKMNAWGRPVPRITIEELDRIGVRINNGQINVEDCLKTNGGQITINTKGGFKKLPYPVVEC